MGPKSGLCPRYFGGYKGLYKVGVSGIRFHSRMDSSIIPLQPFLTAEDDEHEDGEGGTWKRGGGGHAALVLTRAFASQIWDECSISTDIMVSY